MIKKLMIILAMLFSVTLIVACGGKDDAKPEISFVNGNSVSISVMQSYTAEITTTDEGTPIWSVKESQKAFVSVSPESDGMKVKIVGLKKGVAEIEVKTENTSATIQVVIENSAELALLNVQQKDVALLTGGTYSIKPTLIFKEETLNATYEFSSQNAEIAQVDENGVVTATGLGETKINLKADYFGFSFEEEISITVQPVIEILSNCKELSVYKKTDGSPYSYSQALSVEVKYDGTKLSSEEVKIDTVDHEIAVIESGKVIGLNKGQTKVEIKFTISEKEYKDYIFVNVKDLPQVEIRLSKENITMYEYYREYELTSKVFVDGEEVEDAIVSYASQNEAVAKVEDGKVKAVSNGSTKINAVFNDGFEDYSNQADVVIKNSISLASETLGAGVNGIIAEIKENSALCFEKEIDLTSSTKADSLIKFHILSQNDKGSGTADVEYLFVKLTDTENPENYVTFKINKNLRNDNGSCVKVASAGNGYYGWRYGSGATSDTIASDKPSGVYGEMGTNISYSFYADEDSLSSAINLSYDYETNSTYAIKGENNYAFIFDLDTVYENAGKIYTGFKFFNGFKNGKAKLSVYASGYAENVDMVKIYVEEINKTAADSFGLDEFLMR